MRKPLRHAAIGMKKEGVAVSMRAFIEVAFCLDREAGEAAHR